jgi:hypothetical protein
LRTLLATRTAPALIGLVVLLASVAPASSATGTSRLAATLDAHHVVTPKNKPWTPPASVAKAHGSFAGTLSGRSLRWRITYAGVGSSPLKIADVHYGKPGQFGAIIIRLCGPCTSGQSGTKKLTASGLHAIVMGTAWVTVITGTYPNGVIRGQITTS